MYQVVRHLPLDKHSSKRFDDTSRLPGGHALLRIALLATVALSIPSASHAQLAGYNANIDEGADNAPRFSIGDIMVTARKRNESIVNVPEAMTTFSMQQIEKASLQDLRDFTDLTPNITFTAPTSAISNVMIRGLAQAANGEAPVAVVIDGVQLAHPAFLTQDYGDVGQVEILRGPQGSLYGRNAIGGAINITTRAPTNDLEGRINISYGSADSFLGSVDLSGPIVKDKILFRVSGSYRRTDGQIRSIATGERADHARKTFLRGRLILNLSEQVSLDIRANYGRDRVGVPTAEIAPDAFFDDFSPGFLMTDPVQFERRTIYDFSALFQYQGEYLNISSISGYSRLKDNLFGDADFSRAHFVLNDVNTSVKALTQEVRIASPSDQPFRWLVGAFYQDRDTRNFLDIPVDDGTGSPLPGVFSLRSRDVGTSKAWAVFGSASYALLPKLEITLGARYDEDKRTSVDDLFAGSAIAGNFTAFQPKIQISYKPSAGWNIYSTYGEGFGSGGYNAFFSGPTVRLFKAQTAKNYEVGVKGALADNRVHVSANIFRVYYDNQQLFFTIINPPSQNITNIDRTRVDGAEVELTARPFQNLDLSAGLGLMDSQIVRFAAASSDVSNRSPQTTKYTLNFTGQYRMPLTGQLGLRAHASYRRQGSIYWDTANTLKTPAKDFVNLRLSLEGTAGWSIGAFANNITDSRYPVFAQANAFGPGLHNRIPSPRRSYGVEAAYHF